MDAGQPKTGNLSDLKNAARKKYKYLIHGKKIESKKRITQKLQDTLYNASSKNTFWKIWKGSFNSSNASNNTTVNDSGDKFDVANIFAENFQKACTPNDHPTNDRFKQQYFQNKKNYANNFSDFTDITVETVDNAIIKMSLNKASGLDNLSIEHIKYAHPSIVVILSKLFNLFAYCGIVPDDFGLGVTKPIPKFKGIKKCCTTDDFRGITICPIISKIFEHCLLSNFNEFSTSDRQFGFKTGSSCHMAIHSVKKVIKYFNDKGSTINIGAID